jgi:hypothetical protein
MNTYKYSRIKKAFEIIEIEWQEEPASPAHTYLMIPRNSVTMIALGYIYHVRYCPLLEI